MSTARWAVEKGALCCTQNICSSVDVQENHLPLLALYFRTLTNIRLKELVHIFIMSACFKHSYNIYGLMISWDLFHVCHTYIHIYIHNTHTHTQKLRGMSIDNRTNLKSLGLDEEQFQLRL
jgi:hypothetical protein